MTKEQRDTNEKILVTRSSMPSFDEYVEMIRPLWDSHWITNMGSYHKQLECELEKYLKVEKISLTVNGHTALELAIQSLNLPMGGEVITTPFTFISTTHAIIRNQLKPIFCDIKEDYTIDETKIEELITENTVAIIPVHVYGNICNVEKIQEIADKYDLKVIYDAAHAFGETYKGIGVGNFGDLSIFSFHATKVFNTIEGGAVCCHNNEQYNRLYNLKNFGIRSEELVVSVGANAKMNEFQAAMGLCNLKHLENSIERRKKAVEAYYKYLGNRSDIQLNKYSNDILPNYGYMPVLFHDGVMRDRIYELLRINNIYSRKYFYPITADEACFRNKYKNDNLERARDYAKRVLVLPLYEELDSKGVERISELILRGLER
ncbi:MAG: DegT/DnrJ/EryC1/StrS family aminotransferase [Lachnospiraceae bacterium]